MEKNTVIAIVLSSLVLIISLFIQSKYIYPRQQQKEIEQAREKEIQLQAEKEKVKKEEEMVQSSFSDIENGNEQIELDIKEYKIVTQKAEITLTNIGGDITSYRLLEHEDKKTGEGVEMVSNVTPSNRAFSLSFGGVENLVLNDVFNVTQKDDKTILFYRDYEIKDEKGNPQKITLGKKYTFAEDDYVFKLEISVISAEGVQLSLGDSAYTIRTSPQIGPEYDKKNRYEVRQFLALNNGKKMRKTVSDKQYELGSLGWAGIGGKYFTMLIRPVSPSNMLEKVKIVSKADGKNDAQMLLSRKPIMENSVNDTYYVYVGPRQEKELIKYNDTTKNYWNLSGVKFNEALQTSGFLSWIEVVLKWGLEKINLFAKNWGVSIIILTIILRIILFPLNRNSAQGSVKMQALQPKIQALQEKYKDDQQKLSLEMQKLYKEVGYNPVSGCLPMIIQMFILFALYNVFNNYFEFRGASFIKGWIDDLSTGDSILSWKKEIPFISAFTMNNLRLLPFIYTVSQLLNGKITQYGNPGAGTSQGQMKFMMYGMPVMFFFLFYNVPSGLLLYWATSNILQIGQQLLLNRIMKNQKKEIVEKPVLRFKGGKKKTR